MNGDLPVPIVNADSAAYREAARNGTLVLQRCGECGTLRFFLRYLCTGRGAAAVRRQIGKQDGALVQEMEAAIMHRCREGE